MQTCSHFKDKHRHIAAHLHWLLYFSSPKQGRSDSSNKTVHDAKICLFIHFAQMKKMSMALSSLTSLSGGKDKFMRWGLACWKHWNCKADCGDLLYNQAREWLLISVRGFWRGTKGLIVHSCHIDILASVESGGLSGSGMSWASGLGFSLGDDKKNRHIQYTAVQIHEYLLCKTLSVAQLLSLNLSLHY